MLSRALPVSLHPITSISTYLPYCRACCLAITAFYCLTIITSFPMSLVRRCSKRYGLFPSAIFILCGLLAVLPFIVSTSVPHFPYTPIEADKQVTKSTNKPDITWPTDSGHIGGFTPAEDAQAKHITAEPSFAPTAPFHPGQVRLAQYNFFMRPPGINSNGNDYKTERLAYFIENELSQFDIIAFQEMFAFGSERRTELIKAAYTNGYAYSVSSPRHSGFGLRIDGGLVLISRFPIVRSAVLTFDRGIDSDWFAAKGVIYAKLDVGGKNLHIFTTHLQASYSMDYPMTDSSVKVRMKQLYDMRRFMDEQLRNETASDATIFAGDLNINGRPFDSKAADRGESSQEYGLAMSIIRGDGVDAKTIGISQPGQIYTSTEKVVVNDLLLQARKMHPETFADVKRYPDGTVESDASGKPVPMETQLTDKTSLSSRQRLDFILSIQRGQYNSTSAKQLKTSNTKVEHFFVDQSKKALPVIQLSDHYGVSTLLE
ncbi:Endonuclease/exonuclease/phosphatase [Syncephalis fuscata]|nr:Endonuclease/exonuclease/phosphatase [Syncephalis fuscata]